MLKFRLELKKIKSNIVIKFQLLVWTAICNMAGKYVFQKDNSSDAQSGHATEAGSIRHLVLIYRSAKMFCLN